MNKIKFVLTKKFTTGLRMSPLAIAMISLFSSVSHAELYFAPELIANDPQMVADLSHFEKEGVQLPGEYPVDIYLNGKMLTAKTVRFILAPRPALDNNVQKDQKASNASVPDTASPVDVAVTNDIKDGTGLMACLTRKDFDNFGVNVSQFPTSQASPDTQCVSPGAFIPAAYTAFDFQKMRLDISIPQAAMRNKANGYIEPELWDDGISAGLLNYTFSGSDNDGRYGDSQSHYLNLNSGLNLGPWRFRDYRNWSHYSSQYGDHERWQHIKTYAERAITPLRSALTMGESTSGSDVFNALGFRGVQLATDDNMYPDTMRGFAPTIRGTAGTNAQVSIRQNGYTIYQTFVPPGAFAITDLYPMYSGGDLEVTVREATGSSRVFTVPYSSLPVLQREGHVKYGLTAGRYQGGSDRYDDPTFAQGTLIWGLPHNITTYGGLQYSSRYFAAAFGSGINLGGLGAISADITQANSTLADGSQHQGQSLRFLYAHSLSSLGTTFQLTGYRYSTKGYHTLEETALNGMSGWLYDNDMVDADGRPAKHSYTDYFNLYNVKRARLEASVSQRIGKLGSVYLTGIRQTYWNNPNVGNTLQAGLNTTIGAVSYNLSYSYSHQPGQFEADKSIFVSLSVPLNALLPSDGKRDSPLYATFNNSRDNDGRMTQQAGLSGSMLENNNLNWHVSQGHANEQGNSGSASMNYQGGYGNGNVGYSYSRDYRQVSYGVSGGAILHRNGLTIGQPLGETSVLIAAPGASGIAIENERGVHTDWRGYAIKPYASAYRENRIALDTNSLDDYTDIDGPVSRVVPTKGAIVRAGFAAHRGRRVLMTLTHNDTILPLGATVNIGERTGLMGDAGQVYLSGLPEEGDLRAQWGPDATQRCTLHYRLPVDNESATVSQMKAVCQ